MSLDIYYMCWNQMEVTHSSQHRVTAVTPVPHKKRLSLLSMDTGLDWCLQRPTPGLVRQPVALIISTSLHLAHADHVVIFKTFAFINTFCSVAGGRY